MITATRRHDPSRRGFLQTAAAPFLAPFWQLAAAEKRRVKIRDVQTMIVKGPRTYTYVKILSDDGLYGIAEAYGSPGVGVKEQILSLKSALVGKNPLEIDTIYTSLGERGESLSGSRTDVSAHSLMRAATHLTVKNDPFLLPGMTVRTTSSDHFPLERAYTSVEFHLTARRSPEGARAWLTRL